uniref:Uncharacterized protein n=1 Tax=uncultured Spirochaetaceae bacterium TaxID=201186 RepID=A0A650F595_9SPIO|nr:hypothetical protein Unknown280_0470 [uncultured Spirochaetaceae bacterium]
MKKISVKIEKKEDYITLDVKKEKIKDTETEYISERLVMTHTVQPTNFTQLYIPFDCFKRACKFIQSYYSETNDYVGYHNFMHYWAMNGNWRWIGDTDEAGEVADPFKKLNYTYLSTGFWNDFKPEKKEHPLSTYNGNVVNW